MMRKETVSIMAAWAVAATLFFVAPTIAAEKACLTMSRTVDASYYVPGETLAIRLYLESVCVDVITSLGIEEALPDGWRFVSGEALEGAPPVQWQTPGESNTLNIFWVAVPTLPVVLRYVVQIPENTQGPATFTGSAIYSLSTGPQRRSDVVTTTLSTQSEDEYEGEDDGEGEGEDDGEGEGERDQEGEPVEVPQRRGCCRPARESATANNICATRNVMNNVLLLGTRLLASNQNAKRLFF